MNPKEKDIPYCGVDIEKIKNAKPQIDLELLKRYAYYQKERTLIYYTLYGNFDDGGKCSKLYY